MNKTITIVFAFVVFVALQSKDSSFVLCFNIERFLEHSSQPISHPNTLSSSDFHVDEDHLYETIFMKNNQFQLNIERKYPFFEYLITQTPSFSIWHPPRF